MDTAPERRSFLQSPRNQRRLLFASLVVLALGVMALTFALFRNTGDTTPETFSTEPADVFKAKKTTTIDPAARRVAGRFIQTAVARKNLGESYDLVTPDLRQGMTRKQWETGNIPVVYFPVSELEGASFKVDRSYADEVVWQVYMVPKIGSKTEPAVFFIGLRRSSDNAPWKVFYWAPHFQPAVPDPG